MVFINTTGFIGTVFEGFTTYVSGSVFVTLLAVLILFIGFFTMFRIPVESMIVLIVPLIIGFMAFEAGGFIAIGGAILIFLGLLLAKNWIIK